MKDHIDVVMKAYPSSSFVVVHYPHHHPHPYNNNNDNNDNDNNNSDNNNDNNNNKVHIRTRNSDVGTVFRTKSCCRNGYYH